MLPKKYRLPSSSFQKFKEAKIKVKGKYGMMLVLPSTEIPNPMFGVLVTTKIGNAVIRHKMVRRVSEIFKEYMKQVDLPSHFYEYIVFEAVDDFTLLKDDIHVVMNKLVKTL